MRRKHYLPILSLIMAAGFLFYFTQTDIEPFYFISILMATGTGAVVFAYLGFEEWWNDRGEG